MEAGGREDERRSKVKGERVPGRGVTYLRALGVAPSPKTLATSTMFGTEGEATSSMAIKSFLSALSVQVILLPTACPIGMMGDVMCVGSEVMFVCVVEREERLGMMARERSRRKAERGKDS